MAYPENPSSTTPAPSVTVFGGKWATPTKGGHKEIDGFGGKWADAGDGCDDGHPAGFPDGDASAPAKPGPIFGKPPEFFTLDAKNSVLPSNAPMPGLDNVSSNVPAGNPSDG